MKLFVALGPGDIVGAARSRLAGVEIPETSTAFSEQLFKYCKAENLHTLAISAHSRPDQIRDQQILIENRPKFNRGRGGILFHLAELHYACYLAIRARRFGADFAIIDSGTTHYFFLAFFYLLGIPVAVNLHNVFWPVGFPPRAKVKLIIHALNSWFFRTIAAGGIGVSPECERQFLTLSRNLIPFFQYRCQFTQEGFHQSLPYQAGVFNVACVGRVEENKGFLDLVEMAECLRNRSDVPVVFHVCGDGPALPLMRQMIIKNNLGTSIICYGRLERKALLNIYAISHATIVPTRSTFMEGMPQVCAEAVLSGLPVITSPVSNAFDVIGSAIIATQTDNIDSYVTAILTLINDHDLYRNLRAQCPRLSYQFLDPSQGYSAAVNRLVKTLYQR